MFPTWRWKKDVHQIKPPRSPPNRRRRIRSSYSSLPSREGRVGRRRSGGWMRERAWQEGDERESKMRTICDVCESAPAVLFCAADEAALCRPCDEKVHMCNKLASRHVRVGLADPSDVPHCDICENAPAFFYCEIDGSSLCLQCDMVVHVGGKRTHRRYLLLRQRVEFPGNRSSHTEELKTKAKDFDEHRRDHKMVMTEKMTNGKLSADPALDATNNHDGKMDSNMIDLNTRPVRIHEQASSAQAQQMDLASDNNHTGPFQNSG